MKVRRKKEVEYKENIEMLKSIPVPTWNRECFDCVCRDRGYQSDSSVALKLSEELGYSTKTIKEMLRTGRMTWGQVLVIGSVFEMTPREFCDSFLYGYFQPRGSDAYRANVENPIILLRVPIAHPKYIPTDDGWTVCSDRRMANDAGRPPVGTALLVTTEDGAVSIATEDYKRGMPPSRLYWTDEHGDSVRVTAWQPLPKPCTRKYEEKGDL